MKLKDKFNLSHVAGFFVGVVVTVIFNWIVFKDPKRVTAPGVAALVAMCTFTLALWSASQVKEFMITKKKEAGFNQTIKIIGHIEGCYEMVKTITTSMLSRTEAMGLLGPLKISQEQADEIKENHEKIDGYCDKIVISIKTLKYWGVELTTIGYRDIDKLINTLRDINNKYNKIVKETESTKILEFTYAFNDDLNALLTCLQNLTDTSYEDLFIISHNP